MLELEILSGDKKWSVACELYWELDDELNFVHRVADIANLMEVNQKTLLDKVKISCNAIEPNWQCSDCGKPYRFKNRTDFIKNRELVGEKATFLCGICHARRKEKELEEEMRNEQLFRQKIQEIYDLKNRSLLDVNELLFTDIVYLLSVFRAGITEDLSKILPPRVFGQKLTPNEEYTTEILKYLYDKHLLFVHPDTEPEAFVNGDIGRFYIWHVYYAPPLNKRNPKDTKSLIQDILHLINAEWKNEWFNEAYDLWKRVALEECKEYLIFVLKEHHFDFSPGNRTVQYIEFALENFSTAQVFNIIWRASKDAAAYYQRSRIPKKQAANSAVGSIQRIAERAIAEGWEIKPFNRNFNCPQTAISETLYNSIMKMGNIGFTSIPDINTIHERLKAIDEE